MPERLIAILHQTLNRLCRSVRVTAPLIYRDALDQLRRSVRITIAADRYALDKMRQASA